MSTPDDQTINLPQLFLIIVLGGLALRYFFFSPASSTLPSPAGRTSRAREADVERIQQMFPQLERRNILWDLQRNGGNVVATTERILSGRGLEVPPQSFQPLPPPAPSSSSSTTRPSTTSSTSKSKAPQPDLITRYNLQNRLSSPAGSGSSTPDATLDQAQPPADPSSSPSSSAPGTPRPRKSWSANKNERQALLQRRRDEMILAARRKMEERVAREKVDAEGGAGVAAA